MKEYLVCQVAFSYGVSLLRARRFTEEEKAHYTEEYRERGFKPTSDSEEVELKELDWKIVRKVLNGMSCLCLIRNWERKSSWMNWKNTREFWLCMKNRKNYIRLKKQKNRENATMTRTMRAEKDTSRPTTRSSNIIATKTRSVNLKNCCRINFPKYMRYAHLFL